MDQRLSMTVLRNLVLKSFGLNREVNWVCCCGEKSCLKMSISKLPLKTKMKQVVVENHFSLHSLIQMLAGDFFPPPSEYH